MSKARGVIGLDIGSVAIKFVALDEGHRVGAHGIVPRLAHGGEVSLEEACRIRSILERRGIESTRIAMGAPATMATSAVLELPPRSSGAPIDDLGRMEIARIMRAEPDAVEFVCWEIPFAARASSGTTVMGVGCISDRAAELVGTFADAGLTVESIEPECVAVARAASAWCEAESCVTIDLGASSGRVCVVVRGMVAMERDLGELGVLDRLARASGESGLSVAALRRMIGHRPEGEATTPRSTVSDTLASEIAEDAVRAVRESVAYVHGRASDTAVERVCLCGWGAEIPGLAGKIRAELGVQTMAIGPECAIGERGSPVFALAAGLALGVQDERGKKRGTRS